MGILGSLIGGIAGIGQSAIEARTAKRNTDMTIDANRKMAEYQYSKDLEMWNKANEYNDPASQMKRYQNAGLNPNLIYGTGSASAGNTATTLPKYQAPTAEYNYKPGVNLGMTLSMFQDFAIKQAQVDNLREQNRILVSTADMKYLDSLAYGAEPFNHDKTTMASTLPLIKREAQKSQLLRSQADAIRVQTDAALKQLQLMWFKKLGVTGLGGAMSAVTNALKWLK